MRSAPRITALFVTMLWVSTCVLPAPRAVLADGVVGGRWVTGPVDPSTSAPGPRHAINRPSGVTLIDFDSATRPCEFRLTTVLRDEYLPQGVRFAGSGTSAGGAVLDACGSFGVSGYSGSDFLAFNVHADAVDQLGNVPRGPERITFSSLAGRVQVLVGTSFSGGVATMHAYDSLGNLLATASIPATAALQPLTITLPGIRSVDVDIPGVDFWVLDDLTFEADQLTGARPASWGRLKTRYQ